MRVCVRVCVCACVCVCMDRSSPESYCIHSEDEEEYDAQTAAPDHALQEASPASIFETFVVAMSINAYVCVCMHVCVCMCVCVCVHECTCIIL